jgi:hypothetical protein
LKNLFTKEEIDLIVASVIKSSYSTTLEHRSNSEVLIQLAKQYSMHSELITMIINDCIDILKMKTPSILYRPEIHGKEFHKIPTENIYKFTIKDKYMNILEEYSNSITSYSLAFKVNFKFLRQLENIEEIYSLIKSNGEQEALKVNYFKFLTNSCLLRILA